MSDHHTDVTHGVGVLVAEIRETHKMRVDLLRAEKRLTNQIKAICRRLAFAEIRAVEPDLPFKDTVTRAVRDSAVIYRDIAKADAGSARAAVAGTAALPLLESRAFVHAARLGPERRLRDLAEKLPVYPWWEAIYGVGPLGLAQIVGEAGDLSKYDGPAKLWKRMGVGMVNVDGKPQRQRRTTDKDLAIEMGYSAARRSILYSIGDSLIKKQNEYRDLYLERKEIEREKLPGATKMHVHRRAQRYMEKRLLRNLWRAWRAERRMISSMALPAAPPPDELRV